MRLYLQDLIRLDQRVRFLLAGGFASGVSWASRFLFNTVMPFALAVATATALGMVIGFLIYRSFVFPGSSRSLAAQLGVPPGQSDRGTRHRGGGDCRTRWAVDAARPYRDRGACRARDRYHGRCRRQLYWTQDGHLQDGLNAPPRALIMPPCCFPARGVKTDCRASADHPLAPCRARSSAGAARDPPKPRRSGRIAPPGVLRSGRPGMQRLTRARRRDFAIAEVSATSCRTVV